MQMPEIAKQMPHVRNLDKRFVNLSFENNFGIFCVVQKGRSGYEMTLGAFTLLINLQLQWCPSLGYNFIFNAASKPSPAPEADYRESQASTLQICDKIGCHKQ